MNTNGKIVLLGVLAATVFGVALQNILMTVVFLFFIMEYLNPDSKIAPLRECDNPLKKAALAMTAMLSITAWASTMNFFRAEGTIASYLLGHLTLFAFPLLFIPRLKFGTWFGRGGAQSIANALAFLGLAWTLVILSQWAFGWKLSGLTIVFDPAFHRARGLYSHPLTLAYVALILLPSALCLVRERGRRVSSWCILFAILTALYFSMSRTAQAVGGVVVIWFVATISQARLKKTLFAAMAVTALLVFSTDNLISQRFKVFMDSGLKQWSEEKESDFADDRLAFWRVHWKMFTERPILGHGAFMDAEYRRPYYSAIGLPGFKKAYEAHNQYLQILTEGGILALGFFCAWITSLVIWCRQMPQSLARVGYQTLFVFLVSGFTQNAYHDSEVRYALMVVMLLGLIAQVPVTEDVKPRSHMT